MENKSVSFIKETAFTITSVIPFALSMAVCSGMGAFAGAVFACIAALSFPVVEQKKQMPIFLSFLIITYAFKAFGAATASLAIIICGILLIISAFFAKKIKSRFESASPAILPALMLAGALTVTVLFTTDYFGIGASGNTVKEIIASYLSLGFHPNWRGVLYGTIVMVIMITFPRKFKKACRITDAAFLALIITTALNLFLNPSDMVSAIQETGNLSFDEYKNSVFIPLTKSSPILLNAIICAVALFLPCFYMITQKDNFKKTDLIIGGVSNCAIGFGTCMALPCGVKKEKIAVGFTSAILTAIIFILLNDFIARIPVHSCAVVIIVGTWQSVKWSKIKTAFSKPLYLIIFAVVIIACLLLGIVNGIIISAFISVLLSLFSKSKSI